MKAKVRAVVEKLWGIQDGADGEISELVLTALLGSNSIPQLKENVSNLGIDPSAVNVEDLYQIISRMKKLNISFEIPDGYRESKKVPSTAIKRVIEYEDFQEGENITGINADESTSSKIEHSSKHPRVAVSDYDLFEAQQLRKLGVKSLGDQELPRHVQQSGQGSVEIMKSDSQPSFLSRKGLKSTGRYEPVEFVRDPTGTLSKAAVNQAQLAQERREMKESERKEKAEQERRKDEFSSVIKEEHEVSSGDLLTQENWKEYMRRSTGSFGKRQSTASIEQQRESLPIFQLRNEFLKAVQNNQILCVIGETGSGKTTQMTQYLIEEGYDKQGIVACTQPRRVAAISIAKRVAEEFGCRLGQEVGYSIRFDDTTSPKTIIKYMTDGMLLREVLIDPDLRRYSVIILDEAHERTVSTDVLFGLCKAALKRRADLKLIVTSATLDSEKFSNYFYNATIFTIPGRTFPVEIFYSKAPEDDYVEAALSTVMEIHLTKGPGDILVFLTGQEEIDMACQVLHDRMMKLADLKPPPLIPLPVYSALPSEMQTAIFETAPPGCRKCVIATNIAEASVTIDGIYFVVDPGFAKIKVFNPRAGMDSLIVSPISQASARQRAGRAGRTGPGQCYRLYTEHALMNEMLPTAVPEIQRSNLANIALMLKAMGIEDLIDFDFMDKPSVQTLVNALETLWLLGALDDEGYLTKLGRRMAEFPMAPEESKMLLAAVDLGCADDVITIVAMLSVQTIFYRPKEKQAQADERKKRFFSSHGDHCTLLDVYRNWERQGHSSSWCRENFIVERSLKRAQDVRKQLIGIMDRFKLRVDCALGDNSRIRKAICAGYFRNACKRDREEGYRIIRDDQQAFIHPSSVMYQKSPEYVIYHELVQTTREYLRDLCVIEPHWLPELAPKLFAKVDASNMNRAKQGEKVRPLYNKFEDESVWRLSKRMQR
jgi:ATP-dependent RNA helicase DHX8/PRP22